MKPKKLLKKSKGHILKNTDFAGMSGEIFKNISQNGKQTGEIWTENDFTTIKELAPGTYSKAFQVKENASGIICVMKRITVNEKDTPLNKSGEDQGMMTELIMREINTHKLFDHPNIVKLHGYFTDEKYYYLITEYGGDELFTIVSEMKYEYTDDEVRDLFRMALTAAAKCHSEGVMHRDIKLENLVYNNETKILKLIDFGNAIISDVSNAKAGTHSYMAPEVFNITYDRLIPYGNKVDTWSLGCVFFILTFKIPPFSLKHLYYINIDKYIIRATNYMLLKKGKLACTFLSSMFIRFPSARLTVNELLYHPYFHQPDDLSALLEATHI